MSATERERAEAATIVFAVVQVPRDRRLDVFATACAALIQSGALEEREVNATIAKRPRSLISRRP